MHEDKTIESLSFSAIEFGKSYLEHGDWEEHKCIAKVRRPNGKYRYFYSVEEYQSYLRRNGGESILDDVFSFLGDAGAAIASFFSDSAKNVAKALSDAASFVDKNIAKPVGSFMKDTVNKGINFVRKLTGQGRYGTKYKYVAKVVTDTGYTRYFYSMEEYERYKKRQEYQANEPDFMKDVPEYDGEMTMEANSAEVNPNWPMGEGYNMKAEGGFGNNWALIDEMGSRGYDFYNKDSYAEYMAKYYPYAVNCSLCTLTYELRERGYDVEAKPNGTMVNGSYLVDRADTGPDWISTAYENPQSKSYGGNLHISGDNSRNKYDIVDDISKEPAGSRGEIAVYWSGGGGHSVAYTVGDNNEVTVRDTQTNDTYTLDDLLERSDYIRYTRTDNLKLKEECLKYVTDNVD